MNPYLADLLGAPTDLHQWIRIGSRLLAALAVGTIIGMQRERIGKSAGMRTHILVALGTAMFVIAAVEHGMGHDALSRVIQGLATGIGFLGAGSILKRATKNEIHGLTTAAGIWMTAALSVAIGLGQLVAALVGAAITWAVLSTFVRIERRMGVDVDEGDEP